MVEEYREAHTPEPAQTAVEDARATIGCILRRLPVRDDAVRRLHALPIALVERIVCEESHTAPGQA